MESKYRYERISVTESVKGRLSGLPDEVKALGLTLKSAPAFFSAQGQNIRAFAKLKAYPSLYVYLTMGELLNWDLHRDVNWLYAHQDAVKLPARLRRLACYPGILGDKDQRAMFDAALSGNITCRAYSEVLRAVAVFEQGLGFDDALDLEG